MSQLTNEQKALIANASSFSSNNVSWSEYENTDGVSGLNFYYYVSAFPMGNALTQTWNRDLAAAQFEAVGKEYKAVGYNLVDGALLGPLGRVPEGKPQRPEVKEKSHVNPSQVVVRMKPSPPTPICQVSCQARVFKHRMLPV